MKPIEIEVKELSEFKGLMEIVSKVVDTARFKFSSKGMKFASMDPSHVAMLFVKLPAGWFEKYECEKKQELRLNTADFNRVLKRSAATDTAVKLSADVTYNKLRFQFAGKSTRTFRIPLLADDDEESEPPSPKLDLAGKCTLAMPLLAAAIKDANVMGDYVVFTVNEGELFIESDGESGDVSTQITDFSEAPQVNEKQTSKFSMDYLMDVIKTESFAPTVTVELGTDMPLILTFPLEHEAELRYILAPRVDEPEQEEVYDESEGEPEDHDKSEPEEEEDF